MNSEVPTTTVEVVRSRLAEHLSEERSGDPVSLEVERICERPFSSTIVFRHDNRDTERRFVAKVIKCHPMIAAKVTKTNQAIVEFDALRRLHPMFEKVSGCAVPGPVLVLPESDSYVMEYVAGNVLIEENRYFRYLASTTELAKLLNYYGKCGEWLKHLQEFTVVKAQGGDVMSAVVERLSERLTLIERATDPLVPRDFGEMVRQLIEKQLDGLDASAVLLAARHGDFGPWNVLAGDDGVAVIDFLGFREDPLPVDFLKMLIFLQDEGYSPLSSPKRVALAKHHFLEGYGPLPEVPRPAALICEAMQRVVSIWGRVSSKVRTYQQIERRRVISNHLKWFESGCEKLLWVSTTT